MDMTKNKYVTKHMNELHDTKFHYQANLKKIGYYTIFLLALIVNVIFCEKYGGVSTTPSFKKKWRIWILVQVYDKIRQYRC
jgi:hypothetical protein